MSSSADSFVARASAQPRPAAGPRVGVLRGVVASQQPVTAEMPRPRIDALLDPRAVQAARDRAEQAGYEDGYAAGMAAAQQQIADAQADHTQRCADALTALTTAAEQLHAREATGLEQVADQTAALALQIAEVVLEREITATTDPGREAITRAMALAPEEGDVTVRMHPTDIEVLEGADDLAPGRRITVVPDTGIVSGGCLVSVGATRIDAQIPTALARVAEVLR